MYAVMGCVLPYLPVFLDEHGFDFEELSWVMSMVGVAVIATPLLLALLADTSVQSRTLIAGLFAIAAATLGVILRLDVLVLIMLAYGLHTLAQMPMNAIQDGMTFRVLAHAEELGIRSQPYHRIRVYGTYGFMLPSIIIWALITFWDMNADAALITGAVFALLGLVNAGTLPELPRAWTKEEHGHTSLPTAAAARAMVAPDVAVFCLAMFLLQVATASLYTFFPVYVTKTLSIGDQWVGPIIAIGVGIEIFFMIGFGRLTRWLGLRRLMVLGAFCMVLRFALLWLWIDPIVAIGTQVLHGMTVMAVHVAPAVYLNSRAGNTYRNSIQGLYGLAIYGTGRILGNLLAGFVAETRALPTVFAVSAALCAAAAVLFVLMFERTPASEESVTKSGMA